MYTERKIQSGFVGTLCLVALLILFFFHTRPAAQHLSELQQSLTVATQEVDQLTAQKSALTPRGTLTEVEQKDLSQAIPQNVEQYTIIADLSKIAQSTNVSINSLSFSLQKGGDIPALNTTTGIQGTADNVIRFLKLVEVNPRKIVVKDASLSRSEGSGGVPLVNVNVTLQAFYRNAP